MRAGRRDFLISLGSLPILPFLAGCLSPGRPSSVQVSESFEPWIEAPYEIGSQPAQSTLQDQPVVQIHPAWSIQPVARYALCARVLGAQRYRFDDLSEICPVDLALAWGEADDDLIQAEIDVSQSGRWYRWRSKTLPLPSSTLNRNMANVHMIPANEALGIALLQIEEGDRVAIEGLLVDLLHTSGRRSNSSRSRTDSGAGACEILYVQRVQWL